ncbi:hypothetical protein ABZX85_38475 [Streptomyces sp. NPDC004539]|uniref:hypothetical protein n=1 Tax=Streptomyces sp. NPDC004539 TaxID=3154280 RepID=UPI0033A3959E
MIRPQPHQITEALPTYVTPPPRLPQPPAPTPKFTLWTVLLTTTSVLSLAAAVVHTLPL